MNACPSGSEAARSEFASAQQQERGEEFFGNSLEHLLAEFERIELLIQSAICRARKQHAGDPEFQGLCISEREVDAALAAPCGLPRWAHANATIEAIPDGLAKLKSGIDRQAQASLARGVRLRLQEVTRLFALDQLDRDILLVCLAPEMDLRYEKVYAYLQDDVTKKRPSVDLVLNLLSDSYEAKIGGRKRFMSGSKLIDQRLVQLFVDSSQPEPPLLRKYCKLDERVANFLLEADDLVEPLRSFGTIRTPATTGCEVLLDSERRERLSGLCRRRMAAGQNTVVYFQGPAGAGKLAAAESLCGPLGYRLLVVDGRKILENAETDLQQIALLVVREAKLSGAAVFWQRFDLLLIEDKACALDALLRTLQGTVPLTFFAGHISWEPGADQLAASAFIRIEFHEPREAERFVHWDHLLPVEQRAADVDLKTVSARFRLNPGSIEAAVNTARSLARWREPNGEMVSMQDLYSACRIQSHHKLAGLARKVDPKYRFEDIILPPDQLQQLHELVAQAKLRHIVLGEWGFERKLSLGKGLNALFSGPPGTGKTMAAEVIANELCLDLYKIDLSQVVSKYIGETEKNLDKIFREAHGSNAILFFDEADSLFGKRSEVKDAHDRYANIEIGYLLQKMEEYEGIAILATNLRQNMDEAFVRRLHVIVEFPFPDEDYRRRIWQTIFPNEAPIGEDVNFGLLARDIRLAGGNIKNIALTAAFCAASDGKVVRMAHLHLASRREHEKLGRTWTNPDWKMPSNILAAAATAQGIKSRAMTTKEPCSN